MAKREPCAGWREGDDIESSELELVAGRYCAWVDPDALVYRWGVSVDLEYSKECLRHGVASDCVRAQLAAEDAARALAADMAAALGGSVAWATEGGSE